MAIDVPRTRPLSSLLAVGFRRLDIIRWTFAAARSAASAAGPPTVAIGRTYHFVPHLPLFGFESLDDFAQDRILDLDHAVLGNSNCCLRDSRRGELADRFRLPPRSLRLDPSSCFSPRGHHRLPSCRSLNRTLQTTELCLRYRQSPAATNPAQVAGCACP